MDEPKAILPITGFEIMKAKISDVEQNIKAFEIKNEDNVPQAKVLEKECTAIEKEIEEIRTKIVAPHNDFVKQVNAKAKELVAPVSDAKVIIRAKQIAWANEQERLRLLKENEVLDVIRILSNIWDEVELELEFAKNTIQDPRINAGMEAQRFRISEKIRMEKEKALLEEQRKKLEAIGKEQSENAEKQRAELEAERKRLEAIAAEQRVNDAIRMENERIKAEDELKAKIKEDESKQVKGMRKVIKFEVLEEEKVPRHLCSPDDKKIREYLKETKLMDVPGLKIWVEDKIQ